MKTTQKMKMSPNMKENLKIDSTPELKKVQSEDLSWLPQHMLCTWFSALRKNHGRYLECKDDKGKGLQNDKHIGRGGSADGDYHF